MKRVLAHAVANGHGAAFRSVGEAVAFTDPSVARHFGDEGNGQEKAILEESRRENPWVSAVSYQIHDEGDTPPCRE